MVVAIPVITPSFFSIVIPDSPVVKFSIVFEKSNGLSIITFGGTSYPRPSLTILIPLIDPSVTTAVAVAVVPIPIPIFGGVDNLTIGVVSYPDPEFVIVNSLTVPPIDIVEVAPADIELN